MGEISARTKRPLLTQSDPNLIASTLSHDNERRLKFEVTTKHGFD